MQRLLTRFRHVAEATQAAKDRAIVDSGLTKAQYSALLMLQRGAGVTATQLAVACEVSQQAMSQTVKRLVTAGFIGVEASAHGGRAKVLHITELGSASLAIADARVVELEVALRDAVAPLDLDSLIAAVSRVESAACDFPTCGI